MDMFEIPEELEGTVLGFAVTTVIFLFVMYLIIRNFRKRTKRCTQTVSAEVFVNGSRMFRSGGKRHRLAAIAGMGIADAGRHQSHSADGLRRSDYRGAARYFG